MILPLLPTLAEAMGCDVVYAVVPQDGQTLEELAERRMWKEVLESKG